MKNDKNAKPSGKALRATNGQSVGGKLFIGSFPKTVSFVSPEEIQIIQSHFYQEIQDFINDRSAFGDSHGCENSMCNARKSV